MGSDVDAGGGIPPVHLIVRLELPDRPPREFSYDFRQDVITMGRDPSNDIQIPLTTVSRNHARIFFELGDYFLEDLGSTHGTKHNGRKLGPREKRLLRDGDSVVVMTFSITFKTSTAKMLDRQPGEKTEQLARRMVQEVLASLGDNDMEPPALRIMNGVDEGRRFEISEDQAEITLGRSPDTDIVLNDQNASRRHCLIKRTWNGFTAQDLGSKNGVVVNGDVIEGAHALKDGDEVQIGGVKLTFIDPASRILDQFGGFSEETVTPGTDDVPEEEVPDAEEPFEDEAYGGDEDAYAEEDHEEHHEEEPEHEPVDDLDPGDMDVEGEEDDGLGELDDGEGNPEAELMAATGKGIGAEVIILVLGLLIFAGAIGFAVFLYL